MKKREELVLELQQNLDKLNLKVDEYENKFNALKGDMRQKFQEELNKMRSNRDKVRYDLSLLKTAGESAYGEMAKGVKSALENLKSAVEKAKDKLGY